MEKDRGPRLIKLREFLSETKAQVVGGLGLGGGIRTMYIPLSILSSEDRALKSSDLWIKEQVIKDTVIARNRLTNRRIKIPLDCTVPSLRRHASLEHLDVTNEVDLLLVDAFPDIDEFLDHSKIREKFMSNRTVWKQYVERRLGRVLFARKFDLSAPGTRLLSFYSSYPLAPGEFWTIKRLRPEWARLLSMWFNSTPNLAQIFLDRTETRGTWMKNDISTLKESRIVDPRRLTHGELTAVSNVFNEVGACSFPSIVDQLEAKHPLRRKIDIAMLKIIGFDDEEADGLLNELYPRLHKEIMALKELMAG